MPISHSAAIAEAPMTSTPRGTRRESSQPPVRFPGALTSTISAVARICGHGAHQRWRRDGEENEADAFEEARREQRPKVVDQRAEDAAKRHAAEAGEARRLRP